MTYRRMSRDEHFHSPGPKRILALDGGGLKGVVTLGFLRRMEDILRSRHGGDPHFRLCHYFDLIAGTSTGAIIAAALARGMTVEEVEGYYLTMGRSVFRTSFFRRGVVRARFGERKLSGLLKEVLGERTTLGDESLQTGVLIVTKRFDTGSPWPLGNNPRGRYFTAPEGASWIPNSEYPLWQVVRSSTAAPHFFDPETFTISDEGDGRPAVRGTFVDGGVSPFNNPALQAFMYATLEGYGVGWDQGADNLLVVSVGTGRADVARTPARLAASCAVKSLLSLMDDCASLVEALMQWMSSGSHGRTIDRELGDLRNDLLGTAPLLTYVRYDVSFDQAEVEQLVPGLPPRVVESLGRMDEPENLDAWQKIGERAAEGQVKETHFPERFDLPRA